MIKKHKLALFLMLPILIGLALALLVRGHAIPILQPQGVIAREQRQLMFIAVALGLGVILPVFVMTFLIVWRYHESNKQARYSPDWDHNVTLESIWWGLPCLIILGLSILTWQSSHTLDPFKPIAAAAKPMTIQVVALQWKWLFIYPEQRIATVNYVQFPEQTPINFEITGDGPMNSFWIPSLGGQIYAMAGMSTHLHLMADSTGSYHGASANLSGKGFAGMQFTARSTSAKDFKNWATSIKPSSNHLSLAEYDKLVRPSENNPIAYYSSPATDLYNTQVMKYMGQAMSHQEMQP